MRLPYFVGTRRFSSSSKCWTDDDLRRRDDRTRSIQSLPSARLVTNRDHHGFDGVAQLRTTRIARGALFGTFSKRRCPSAVTSYRVFSGFTAKLFVESNSFRGTAVANVVGVVVVTSTDHTPVGVM
jgi:hypothetical protein